MAWSWFFSPFSECLWPGSLCSSCSWIPCVPGCPTSPEHSPRPAPFCCSWPRPTASLIPICLHLTCWLVRLHAHQQVAHRTWWSPHSPVTMASTPQPPLTLCTHKKCTDLPCYPTMNNACFPAPKMTTGPSHGPVHIPGESQIKGQAFL